MTINTPYTEAVEEAYASQATDDVVLATLELHHPSFVDDNGQPTAIRVVQNFEDFVGGLEEDAPLNGGEMVTFSKCGFDITQPGYQESQTPTMDISISGVSRLITGYLEAAISNPVPIVVYFRPYLVSDPSGPGMDPPYRFTLTDITVDVFTVSGTCNLNDVQNWPFPADKYTRERFPGLVR